MTIESSEDVQILRSRARALARQSEQPGVDEDSLEVLEFGLARERYAVETSYVQEVVPLKDLTPLPCTPSFVAGIVNVRGRIVTVLEIKKLVGLREAGLTDLHRIILVRDEEFEIGLLADMILGVRTVPANALQILPSTQSNAHNEYLKGVTSDLLIVLDLKRILNDPKIIVHEEVEA